jgi:hypothetical protein
MASVDGRHLLVKSPCGIMIDVYSSVLFGVDMRTHASSRLCDRVKVRPAGFGYREFAKQFEQRMISSCGPILDFSLIVSFTTVIRRSPIAR